MSDATNNNNNNATNNRGGGLPRSTTRTRAVSTRLSLEGVEASMDARSSPAAGLLRFSPRATAGTTGVSPYNRGRYNRTRFFENAPTTNKTTTTTPHNNNNNNHNHHQLHSQYEVSETTNTIHNVNNNKNSTTPTIMDGMNLDELRTLATRALLETGPQQQEAVFYASLLYAKQNTIAHALLLARAYHVSGQYSSCLKLLQESNVLQSSLTGEWMEGLLLACQSLAVQQEWAILQEMAEDACRLSGGSLAAASGVDDAFRPHFSNYQQQHALSKPLEDEDDFGWETLQESIPCDEPAQIHPLARLCVWRGRAYYETGHPLRAAIYWKRALSMDVRAVDAFGSLLEHSLVTPLEAFSMLQMLDFSQQPWLSALYLARLELGGSSSQQTEPENNPHVANDAEDPDTSLTSLTGANNKSTSFAFSRTNLDASSISLSSPMIPRSFTPGAANTSALGGPPQTQTTTQPTTSVQQQVDQAFDHLRTIYKLQNSPQVLALAAKRAYRRYQWQDVLKYCRKLSLADPTLQTHQAGYTYVATLLLLGQKRTLFQLAHAWVEGSSDASPAAHAQAWFAVGAYYSACGRHHVAQRHYCRATRLQPNCAYAWIAFGCSFAHCDESDQALASFRAAQRLSPGEHAALLYMGMEYNRTNHLVLAHNFLTAALQNSGGNLHSKIPTGDPLCWHELGVLATHKSCTEHALECFRKALQIVVGGSDHHISFRSHEDEDNLTGLIQACVDPYWEPTLFNLGHSLRKLRRFEEAREAYGRCMSLCPEKASPYAAYAFCCHLLDEIDSAVEYYHLALSCKPDDAFSTEMLGRALGSASSSSHRRQLDEYGEDPLTAPGAQRTSGGFIFPPAVDESAARRLDS